MQLIGKAEITQGNKELLQSEDIFANKEPFDGYPTQEWVFKQYSFIDSNLQIDIEGKDIYIDLSKMNHIYNQQGRPEEDNRLEKLL